MDDVAKRKFILSGMVAFLALLPLAAFFLFQTMMPGYEDPLIRERTGNYILAAAFVWQILGFLAIRRIVTIRI